MRILYSVLIYLLRPIAAAVVLWRGLSNRGYWEGFRERFGFGRQRLESTLWVHAVSLGEVTAAAPLVRALQTRYPQIPVVLTTGTPTGRARARTLFGASLDLRYLPYDTPGSMRRFVARVRPRTAFIMETELWPNLFHACRQNRIPTILANARLSLNSVARYQRFGGLFRGVFLGDTLVAAQSAEDAERFIAIGAEAGRTQVIGNLKFDVSLDAAAVERGRDLRAANWASRPVWIAGSTHAGEDEAAVAAHAGLEANALLLLVPRHPQRFQPVADLLVRSGMRFERRSAGNRLRPDSRVLLVDTVGELSALYAAVDVAFVGGSLVPVGGHNLLEPAALGVPVITGPYQSNAPDIGRLLMREGAALEVRDAAQLAAALKELFNDQARRGEMGMNGRRVVEMNRGSVARLLELAEPMLGPGVIPSAVN